MSFESSLPVILGFEGGYSNDPDDPGKETNKGITQKTYNAFRKRKDLPFQSVKLISPSEVILIYKIEYWNDSGCRSIPDTYSKLQLFHFDTAVNCGCVSAIKMIQVILGVKVDGVFGPITAGSISKHKEEILLKRYYQIRLVHYTDLIHINPKLKKFLPSWEFRMNKIMAMEIPNATTVQ